MSGDGKWDFGPEDTQSAEDIENALQRVTKNGRRRMVIRKASGAGSAVAALVLVIGSLTFGSGAVESVKTTVVGSSHETTTTTMATTTTTAAPKPSDGRPKTLVASTAKGLVLLDPQTGDVTKVLDPDADPSSIQLSPDAKTVYYDKSELCSSIFKVSIDGGKPSLVTQGASGLALSTDGKWIAYTTTCGVFAADVTNKEIVGQSLVVMNLANGKTHSIAEMRMAEGEFENLMWTHDGKYVVAAVADGETNIQDTFQYDASVKGPVNMFGDVTTKDFAPPGFANAEGPKEPEWVTKQQFSDNSVLAITYCCKFAPPSGPVSAVIVDKGQVTKTFATEQIGGKINRTIQDISSDDKHQYVAYVTHDNNSGESALWVLDKGAKQPVQLAVDVRRVVWR